MVNSDCILQGDGNLISEKSITWPPGTTQTYPDSGDQLEQSNDLIARYLVIQTIVHLIALFSASFLLFCSVHYTILKKQK